VSAREIQYISRWKPTKGLRFQAASLDQALRAAYQQVQQEYGKETTPKRVEGQIEIIRVGDWK
jgi:hypothetical protein